MGKEIAAVMFEVILGENSVEVQVICQKKENRQKCGVGEGFDVSGGLKMNIANNDGVVAPKEAMI